MNDEKIKPKENLQKKEAAAKKPLAPKPSMPKAAKTEAKTENVGTQPQKAKLALILIRGLINIKPMIQSALFGLRLRKKHVCVVIDDTPTNRGAAMKCKDYITYGEINEETYKELVAKRGKKTEDGELKKFFSLAPPRKGFERKGIKTPFTSGGALGYRGTKINDLIKKML